MNAIIRFLWLLRNWRRKFEIALDHNAQAAYSAELQRSCASLKDEKEYGDKARQFFYGLLILIRSVDLVNDTSRPYYSFRLVSDAERQEAASRVRTSGIDAAGIDRLLDSEGHLRQLVAAGDDQPLYFHFFERYGYRFTLLLNLKTYIGTVHHIERLTKCSSGASGVLATLLARKR